MSDITFDRAPRFNELTEWLQQLAGDYPDLVDLDVLGASHEGRELWIATVTNRASGPHDEKPAVWLDGNIHASETTASVALIHLLHALCTGYGSDDRITRALDTRTFYIVPRVNPDGAELALGEVPSIVRATTREWPRADQADGLILGDIDHDGRILQMRVPDDNGTWKASAAVPRLMVARDPDEVGSGPYYRLYREGRIQNYDGVNVPIAPPVAGIDSNRNFPYHWERYPGKAPTGAGDHPMSEPEVRAVVEGVTARPNITAYFAYHTFSGVHLRPYGDQAQDALPTLDKWIYEDLGERYTEITGYPSISILEDFRYDPKAVIGGSGSDWAYDQIGVISWTTEFWNAMKAAGIDDPHPIEWFRKHSVDDELKLLAWADEHVHDGFVDWYEYDHAQLGTVELGGWNSANLFRNPPPHLLEAEVAPHTQLAIFQALIAPELRHRDTIVEPAGAGAWRIRVVVENTGWLPTNVTQQAVDQRAVLPIRAEIELPTGASLVTGSERYDIGQLAGRALKNSGIGMFAFGSDDTSDRGVAEWVVRAPVGTICTITIHQARAGIVRTTVTLTD
ncbi:MAG: M14 family metallopeptidase [Ilumatobacteraceae bacterium]